MTHKAWLDNEYNLWVEALESSTVDNFKEHSQVKRMLSEVDNEEFLTLEVMNIIHNGGYFRLIDNIGETEERHVASGRMIRTIYWALQVLKFNPTNIVEIGGGVGEFYAVMRALGYKGDYCILDLPGVKNFQIKYLFEVNKRTGLNTSLNISLESIMGATFCVSFYALGEFNDELKSWYIENIVQNCEHGFIIWNPHSGASEEITIKHQGTIEYDKACAAEGTLKIIW